MVNQAERKRRLRSARQTKALKASRKVDDEIRRVRLAVREYVDHGRNPEVFADLPQEVIADIYMQDLCDPRRCVERYSKYLAEGGGTPVEKQLFSRLVDRADAGDQAAMQKIQDMDLTLSRATYPAAHNLLTAMEAEARKQADLELTEAR